MKRKEREREVEGRRRYERNEGTYSRRTVVIGGNFIILRHYPRYCNAIKLDTLRTPCGTGGISRALSFRVPSSFSFRFAKTLEERNSSCAATPSPCLNSFTFAICLHAYILCSIWLNKIVKMYASRVTGIS